MLSSHTFDRKQTERPRRGTREKELRVKICIVGCGALGSVLAAHLARLEGVEVYVYEVSESQLRAIQQHGVRISGAAENMERTIVLSTGAEGDAAIANLHRSFSPPAKPKNPGPQKSSRN